MKQSNQRLLAPKEGDSSSYWSLWIHKLVHLLLSAWTCSCGLAFQLFQSIDLLQIFAIGQSRVQRCRFFQGAIYISSRVEKSATSAIITHPHSCMWNNGR
ncbi:unnamed protein product [Musa banksii]